MADKSIPVHIAIIMDGNGRWAKERGLSRSAGHRAGVRKVRELIRACSDSGVKFVTFYAFSNENWKRPKAEINLLMRYLRDFLDKEVRNLMKNHIRFLAIGRDDPLPEKTLKKIRQAEEKTRNNKGLTVILALNYGSRQEIVDAGKKFAAMVRDKEAGVNDLDEDKFASLLYTSGIPDPDILIRTSGEFRISNFLLWQLSYSELYFPKKYWPDFGKDDLAQVIEDFNKRERRFGGLDAVKEDL